jgi:hypothetical protein
LGCVLVGGGETGIRFEGFEGKGVGFAPVALGKLDIACGDDGVGVGGISRSPGVDELEGVVDLTLREEEVDLELVAVAVGGIGLESGGDEVGGLLDVSMEEGEVGVGGWTGVDLTGGAVRLRRLRGEAGGRQREREKEREGKIARARDARVHRG